MAKFTHKYIRAHLFRGTIFFTCVKPEGQLIFICSLCILTICNISYFPFGFEGWIWVLIASVSDLCILLLS